MISAKDAKQNVQERKLKAIESETNALINEICRSITDLSKEGLSTYSKSSWFMTQNVINNIQYIIKTFEEQGFSVKWDTPLGKECQALTITW